MTDVDRTIRQVFLRAASVLALGRDGVGGAVFDRHVVLLARFLSQIPDHPDDPLYAVRSAAAAMVDARLNIALADWTTLRWQLAGAVRDHLMIATQQALERYEGGAPG